jgi:hypothetical protein
MSWRTTQKCVKVFHRNNRCLATKDIHESWGMCTTFIECKTIMIAVLMVMSNMDIHMIRVTWVGIVEMLGVGQSCLLGRATAVDSRVCSMSHLKEKSFWI